MPEPSPAADPVRAVSHRNNRILACHPEAWRILDWRTTESDGMPVILSAETFGSLPVRESQ
jgi:hypothetical protein